MYKCIEEICSSSNKCNFPNIQNSYSDDYFLNQLFEFSEFSMVLNNVNIEYNKKSAPGW